MAPARAGSVPKEPDSISDIRQPSPASSSPSAKGYREAQHAKKRVQQLDLNPPKHMEGVTVEDVTHEETMEENDNRANPMTDAESRPNVWTQISNKLFENYRFQDDWYIAD
ncbi:hypothetical protein LINGRAHAP2_LOCUS23904 [Linum grandiflorum]